MSPSLAPSYALTPIAPMSEGGGSSPFISLGSPTPSASGEGWRRPEQYAGALRTDAAWLNKFQLGGFGELSKADKLFFFFFLNQKFITRSSNADRGKQYK
jgi:hypothetical protein